MFLCCYAEVEEEAAEEVEEEEETVEQEKAEVEVRYLVVRISVHATKT
jgi:hypothetical protein